MPRSFEGCYPGDAWAIVGIYLQAWDLRMRQATAFARICTLAIAVRWKRVYAHSAAVVGAVEVVESAWQWCRSEGGGWCEGEKRKWRVATSEEAGARA